MPKQTTVLFIWDVNKRLRRHLKKRLKHNPDIRLIFPTDISPENLVKLAPDADVIVGWRPTKELLHAAKKLQLVVNPGAGVQHLIELFKELPSSRRILLANCHGNSYFVAQHAVALLLSLANKIVAHHSWMAAGEWRKRDENFRSSPLKDRRIGLLGYGAVNQKVHRFLSGFDLEFSIIRRDWEKPFTQLPTSAKKFIFDELPQFLREIDILVIAVPLTALTQGLIRTKELELLGSNGLLINVARGKVVNEEDLFIALKNGVIAGAAIDVWYNYDPNPDSKGRRYPFSHPFNKLQNVVLSPHRGASPLNDLQRWDEVLENIERAADGSRRFINLVDLKKEY